MKELTQEQIDAIEKERERVWNLKRRFENLKDVNRGYFHPSFVHKSGPNPRAWLRSVLQSEDHDLAESMLEDLESAYDTATSEIENIVDPRDKLKSDIKNLSNPSRAELRDIMERIVELI